MQKFMAAAALLFLLLPGFYTPSSAQNIHTHVDRDTVQVGDIITYTLVLDRDDEYSFIYFPREEQFESDILQFVDRERHATGASRDSVVYRLQFFGIHDYTIPESSIELIDREGATHILQSDPVTLYFSSVLTEGEEEYRPMKPIFSFAMALWPWLLAALLILAAGWLLYREYRKRQTGPDAPAPPEPIPFTDPLLKLGRKLDALSGEVSPLKKKDFKLFYILLGDAIRRYFEDVYDIDALEMTSGEILRALRDYPAEKEIIDSTRKVLNEADMVKFARFEPDIPQAKQALMVAYQFVETAGKVDKQRIETLRSLHEQQQKTETKSVDA